MKEELQRRLAPLKEERGKTQLIGFGEHAGAWKVFRGRVVRDANGHGVALLPSGQMVWVASTDEADFSFAAMVSRDSSGEVVRRYEPGDVVEGETHFAEMVGVRDLTG